MLWIHDNLSIDAEEVRALTVEPLDSGRMAIVHVFVNGMDPIRISCQDKKTATGIVKLISEAHRDEKRSRRKR